MVTRVYRDAGYNAAAFERDQDGHIRGVRDLASTRGFLHAIQLVRRLKPGGCSLKDDSPTPNQLWFPRCLGLGK